MDRLVGGQTIGDGYRHRVAFAPREVGPGTNPLTAVAVDEWPVKLTGTSSTVSLKLSPLSTEGKGAADRDRGPSPQTNTRQRRATRHTLDETAASTPALSRVR